MIGEYGPLNRKKKKERKKEKKKPWIWEKNVDLTKGGLEHHMMQYTKPVINQYRFMKSKSNL